MFAVWLAPHRIESLPLPNQAKFSPCPFVDEAFQGKEVERKQNKKRSRIGQDLCRRHHPMTHYLFPSCLLPHCVRLDGRFLAFSLFSIKKSASLASWPRPSVVVF